jgi:hypothetical protein
MKKIVRREVFTEVNILIEMTTYCNKTMYGSIIKQKTTVQQIREFCSILLSVSMNAVVKNYPLSLQYILTGRRVS